jgi:RNA polymerase sigma-70 factor (ECF subfamily)
VDKSVEKRGPFALSARSVSGTNQFVEKLLEIELISYKSIGYMTLWIPCRDVGCKYCKRGLGRVRKLLILRGPEEPPEPARGVVNRHSGQAFIQGMAKIVDGERTRGRDVPRFDTLARAWMVWDVPAPARRGAVLDQTQELDRFLAEIERRAFRMAQVALRDPDDALDVVQDAMLKLARSYAARPSAEWRPLFYRILENGIRDLQRRRTVRKKFMVWLPGTHEDPDNQAQDPLDNVPDGAPDAPELLMRGQAMEQLEVSLRGLPARQREAFMLRNFEGLDVAETAAAMGCSEGSVKTHYSRAVHALREHLSEVW